MDSNEFGGGAIRNELGYDLAKDINPRDWGTFRIRLLRQQERRDPLLISLCSTCGWVNFPTSLYLCGCGSYSVGKLGLVSITRNCSRYWWVRNFSHWLICPLCCCLVAKSCLTLCDPLDCSLQVPLSMEFSRQEYWSELPLPSPRDLSDPRTELTSPAMAGRFFTTEPPGKPMSSL